MEISHTAYSDMLYGKRVTAQIILSSEDNNTDNRAKLIAAEAQLRELGHLTVSSIQDVLGQRRLPST